MNADQSPTIAPSLGQLVEEEINGGIARDELRRMQIPALIVSGAERVEIVLESESPGLMNGVAILALLFGC